MEALSEKGTLEMTPERARDMVKRWKKRGIVYAEFALIETIVLEWAKMKEKEVKDA